MVNAKAILICGKICCGKSTYAERLRAESRAVLLSVDEIMLRLFGLYAGDKHDAYCDRIQKYLFDKSVEIIDSGSDVILDWGFWTKDQRAWAREFYQSHGIESELHYMDIGDAMWEERIRHRNEDVQTGKVMAYLIDDGLMKKFKNRFEPPSPDEIDVNVAISPMSC